MFKNNIIYLATALCLLLSSSLMADTLLRSGASWGHSGGSFNFDTDIGTEFAAIESIGAEDGTTYSLSAAAKSSFGSLGVKAQASYSLAGIGGAESDATAIFIDTITISADALNGQQGYLNLAYSLDGSISKTDSGNAFVSFFVRGGSSLTCGTPGTVCYGEQYFADIAGTFWLPEAIPFIYGDPFFLRLRLNGYAGTVTAPALGIVGFDFGQTGTGTGSVDFYNTVSLSRLIPTDLNGNEVIGASFTSESGTQYGINGVAPIPEPATLLLLSSGFIMMGFSKLRKRN
jgi:hypothetical protein